MSKSYGGSSSTGKTILKIVAVVFALIALITMFTAQVAIKHNGNVITKITYSDVYFGTPAVVSFIGYILVVLAGIAGVVSIFLPAQSKLITIASTAAALVGSVLVILVCAFYKAGINSNIYDVSGYKLAAGPIVGCVFGGLETILLGLAAFVNFGE